jgi:DNA-binding MarR family transcriptional regulator
MQDIINKLKAINNIENLEDTLIFTANELLHSKEKAIKLFSITHNQNKILKILLQLYPKEISIGQIGKYMVDKKSNISRLIDPLVDKDLLVRFESNEDRREAKVKISEKGILLLNEISEYENFKNVSKENKESLSKQEIFLLIKLLEKFKVNYSNSTFELIVKNPQSETD